MHVAGLCSVLLNISSHCVQFTESYNIDILQLFASYWTKHEDGCIANTLVPWSKLFYPLIYADECSSKLVFYFQNLICTNAKLTHYYKLELIIKLKTVHSKNKNIIYTDIVSSLRHNLFILKIYSLCIIKFRKPEIIMKRTVTNYFQLYNTKKYYLIL